MVTLTVTRTQTQVEKELIIAMLCKLVAKSMYWSKACTLPRQGTRLAPAQFIG